jgi:membrane protease YdiL (CAAX protease family)
MNDELPRHSLARSVVLHLVPGACVMTFYVLVAPHVIRAGYPPGLTLLIAFLLVGIPIELGYLLYQGKQIHGRLTLRGVVLFREPMPVWQYAAFFVVLFVFAFGVLFLISPVTATLSRTVFSWLPSYLQPDAPPLVPAPVRSAILFTLLVGLFVDGLINPVVEELYFRGYLLPRIAWLGWLAPVVNAFLFSLQHYWQPYNFPLIFVIQLAVVSVVYWKRNIYFGMLTHCAANTIGAVMTLVAFSGSP